jgi:predicted nucleic acid-binding protein
LVIDMERIDPAQLPVEIAISAITLAELAAGPHATTDPAERACRQDRLQRAEATFDPLPVDANVARAFGRIYAAVATAGRKARGRRAFDLVIAGRALLELFAEAVTQEEVFATADGSGRSGGAANRAHGRARIRSARNGVHQPD